VPTTGDGRRGESEKRVEDAEMRAQQAEREKAVAVRIAEERAAEAEGRSEEVEREKEIAEDRAREAEREKEIAEDRAREAEREKEIAEDRAREAEREKEIAEDRAREAEREKRVTERERVAAEVGRQESEERLQQLETQWVVEREEIQLTDQELGRGAWATVSVAVFRGARVAAKCVHNQIVSPHNIQLFKREMDMAARIRHPNLLLFIGATLEGQMVILTELMPTSLRRELQRDVP
jgi:hypothetical protein